MNMRSTPANKGELIAKQGKQNRDIKSTETELNSQTLEAAATLQERQLKSGSLPDDTEFDERP